MVIEKGNQNHSKLEAFLNFICGIIKEGLNIFNIEFIVLPKVENYSKHLAKDMKNCLEFQYIFTFNVNIFADNKELDENKT